MYSCFWQSENEDTVRQSVVNFSKIFLCLFIFDATIFKQFRCRDSSGQYLWRNFQPMTSHKYRRYLYWPLTRVTILDILQMTPLILFLKLGCRPTSLHSDRDYFWLFFFFLFYKSFDFSEVLLFPDLPNQLQLVFFWNLISVVNTC